jgi:hypothetical protein
MLGTKTCLISKSAKGKICGKITVVTYSGIVTVFAGKYFEYHKTLHQDPRFLLGDPDVYGEIVSVSNQTTYCHIP